MDFNETTIRGKWHEIKGEIQKAWGKLTGDEIERSKGNIKSLYGTIQQRYGEREEDIQEKMNNIVGRFNDRVEETQNEYRDKAV